MVSSVSACQASIPPSANRMWRANWMHVGQNYENGNPSPSRVSPLQFQKRRQLFIGVHNEPPSVAAMCVSNETSRHLCRASSKCCLPSGTQHYEKQTYFPIRFLSSTRLHRTSCLRSCRLFNAKRSAAGFPPPRSVDQSF